EAKVPEEGAVEKNGTSLDPLFVKEEPKPTKEPTPKAEPQRHWGLTPAEHARYLKRIESLRSDQEEATFRAAHDLERRKQTAEWKDNEKQVRGEVETDLKYSTFLADDS